MATPMQPTSAPTWVAGAPLKPSAALLEWIEANATDGQGNHRLLRLPVAITFAPLGFDSTVVGASLDGGDDAVHLDLNDTAMGIGVEERVRQVCDMDAAGCVVWLHGYWRDAMPMPGGLDMPELDLPGLDAGPTEHPFEVRGFDGLVDPATDTVFVAK